MSERRDYVALDWVAGEIEETLKQASEALAAYTENRDDATKLRFCLTHIHQVHGTLHMVEFFGAALLAEEMEALAQALAAGAIHDSHTDDALSVLNNALIQLPLYLERVKETRQALPATLLPVLNDLRAIRGESLFSETVLFSPSLATDFPVPPEPVELMIRGDELKEVTHKLRQMFQIALLGIIRNKDVKKNLNYLAKACARLSKLTAGRPPQALWRVCIAVLEGLLNGSIEASVSVKILLRHVDRQIKLIIDEGEEILDQQPPADLFKNLLYYVARSKANSRFIKEIKQDYQLDKSLLGEGDLGDETLDAPNPATMQVVVEALAQELGSIKEGLQQAETDTNQLTEVLPLFRRVSDTMAILGMGKVLKTLQDQHSLLAKLLATQDEVAAEDIVDIIQRITVIEQEINPQASALVSEAVEAEQAPALFNDSEEAQEQLDSAFDSVVIESRNGLEQAKETIIEFVATQWNHDCLSDLPTLLAEVRGSLAMIPLSRAANILESCEAYVSRDLLAERSVPDWQVLDTLADAITSVDYYLERLIDRSGDDSNSILDVAAESVAELGYPVAGALRSHEKVMADQEPPTLDQELPVLDDSILSSSIEEPVSDDAIDTKSSIDDVPVLAKVIPILSFAETDLEASGVEITTDSEELVEATALEEDEEFDEEIAEIFVEEAREVLETINECFPPWLDDLSSEEPMATIRRSFHTLKGSGRMARAMDIAELAWSVENMLNRTLDGAFTLDQARVDVVIGAKDLIPGMVDAFEGRLALSNQDAINALMARATALDTEQNPDLSALIFDAELIDEELATEPLAAEEETVVEALSASDTDLDSELLSIFAAEAIVHLQVVDGFIDHCKKVGGPAAFTDELQRALHTLKGSANMAGVIPVAMIVTPVETLVKELRASQLKSDEPIAALFERASQLIKQGVEQLETSPMAILPGSDELIEQVVQLRQERMALAGDISEEDAGIAPEALNEFLTGSLDLISEVSDQLQQWKQGELSSDDCAMLANKVRQFVVSAETVNMSAPVELGEAMQALYRRANDEASMLPDTFFSLAEKGNDTLIDLLDQIAGHQDPDFDLGFLADIREYEFSTDPISDEDIIISLDEDGSEEGEIILDFGTGDVPDLMEALTDAGYDIESNVDDAVELNEENGIEINSEDDSLEETSVDDNSAEYSHSEEVKEELRDIVGIMTEMVEAIAEPIEKPNAAEEVTELIEPEPETEKADTAEAVSITEQEDDDNIDAEILEIFLEEADDLLELIDESVHKWNDDKDNRSYLDDLLRHLHTLKGGARLTGLTVVGDLSHDFETFLEAMDSDTVINEGFLAQVQQFQDDLVAKVELVSSGSESVDEVMADSEVLPVDEPVAEAEIISEEPVLKNVQGKSVAETTEEKESRASEEEVMGELLPLAGIRNNKSDVVPFTAEASPAAAIAESIVNAADTSKKASQEVIKVPASLLENLVNLAGETSISRGRAEEQISELVFSLEEMQTTVDRLQEQVRRLDMETEQQILFRQEQVESEGLEGFDPLEMDRYSALQQLSRSLLESSSDLTDIKSTLADKARDMETLLVQQSRINTELQEGLMRSRMVPFSRMVPRLRRVVRQISGELNKKVDFRLDNVEGELDRTVLERMVAPLEHMLRNAVDHGIESTQEREKYGKSKRGTVRLNLSRQGGEIVIALSDDGGGINLAAVKNKAIERGLMEADAELTDREIMQFILQAGFSTADSVTQISGRGVGMDVVSSEIKQLGGSMEIESVEGKGTQFIVRLPFTVSVNRALMVNVGGDSYAIPLNSIEGIVRVSPFELEAYYQPDAPMFEYAGQPYLLRYMGSLLQRGETPNLEGYTMPLPVILVRGAEHSVAVQVDSLLGSREIVVKPLGPQFSMVQGLSGATVLGDGSVVVILDLLAMIRADAIQLHRDITPKIEGGQLDEEKNILVMVVDDSVTVRKVTSRFLERQGMDVVLAKDGVDAVTQLNEMERLPDVMLLDIEMPRMDGFEVASRVRHTSRLENLSIIMITSRTGEKHRERALSLGVDKYLGKPFQETELLENINELVGVAHG
jgi:chemosensory pili system protein ChpA (sensor histidine kinase/response regulator)